MAVEFFDLDLWIRILFTVLCGSMVGMERQIRGKTVGIRTCILICMGSMLFVYLALEMSASLSVTTDPMRVLAQLITGIGFLGAGVIINKQGLVIGLTSAAVIWLLAGVGAAIGLQRYGVALAICLMSLFVVSGLQIIEDIFKLFKIKVRKRLHGEE